MTTTTRERLRERLTLITRAQAEREMELLALLPEPGDGGDFRAHDERWAEINEDRALDLEDLIDLARDLLREKCPEGCPQCGAEPGGRYRDHCTTPDGVSH